jgi:hypothetical protein
MPTVLAKCPSVAAAAGLTPFLVASEVVKAALLSLLIYFGAADLLATSHGVNRGFLAPLKAAQYLIDDTVVNQRLKFLGNLHRSCSASGNRLCGAAPRSSAGFDCRPLMGTVDPLP